MSIRDSSPTHALTLRVTLPEVTYPTAADAARLIVRELDAIVSLPGVQAVGVSTKLPLSEQGRQDSAVFIEDRPVAGASMAGGLPDLHQIIFVTPGYFRAMGIPLVAGRLIASARCGRRSVAGAARSAGQRRVRPTILERHPGDWQAGQR